MSMTKIIFIALGAIVLVGVAYLIFSGGFVYLFFRSSYETENGKVYYHSAGIGRSEVKGVDVTTFKTVNRGDGFFGEDKNNIYFQAEPLVGVDRESFEILKEKYWSRDKSHIYHGSTALEGIDPAKFRFINENFVTDGTSIFSSTHRLDGADPETFTLVKDGNLAKDKNHYYYFEEKGRLVNGQFQGDEEEKDDSTQK
jgi:hypothetical protein